MEEARLRRQRIAKLRAERRGEKNGTETENGTEGTEGTEKQHSTERLGYADSPEKDTENDSVGQESSREDTPRGDSPPGDTPEHNDPPLFTIGNETVELVAKDIQDRILAKSREIASLTSRSSPIKSSVNQDLKDSLQPTLKLAHDKTNTIINQHVQHKFS